MIRWLRRKRDPNNIADMDPVLSQALCILVKRALKADPTRKYALIYDVTGGSIRGVRVGNWRITAQPIEGEFPPCSISSE